MTTPSRERLTKDQVREGLSRLPGWEGTTTKLERGYDFPEFLAGVAAVDEVATAAEEADHHPDIDIRWRTVTFVCSTHSAGGTTALDLALAETIHRIASAHGGK